MVVRARRGPGAVAAFRLCRLGRDAARARRRGRGHREIQARRRERSALRRRAGDVGGSIDDEEPLGCGAPQVGGGEPFGAELAAAARQVGPGARLRESRAMSSAEEDLKSFGYAQELKRSLTLFDLLVYGLVF